MRESRRALVVGLTKGNNVAEPAELAEVELATLDVASALKHGHGDGSRIREGQADDTHAGEGVESSRRAEVDDTQDNLHSEREHHGVKGQVQPGVDLLPNLGARDGAIASESPGAARGSGGAGGTAKDCQNHERDE